MVLNISISEKAEANLKAKASAAGMDVETYAAQQLEFIVAPHHINDLSGPVGNAFAQNGMSENELSDFLEEEKHAMRRERRSQGPA